MHAIYGFVFYLILNDHKKLIIIQKFNFETTNNPFIKIFI